MSTVTAMLGRRVRSCLLARLLPSWDVSSATTTRSMFDDAELFNSNLADWDTARVANMHDTYVSCRRCTPRGLPAGSRLGLAGRACCTGLCRVRPAAGCGVRS